MAYIGNAPGQSTQRITTTFTATQGQTSFNPVSGYTPGYADVYLNGVKLIDTNDYTATNGVTVVLNQGATLDDVVEVLAYVPRGLTDGYTKIEADARYATEAQGTLADSAVQPNDDVALGALSADGLTVDGSVDVISSAGDIDALQVTDGTYGLDFGITATGGIIGTRNVNHTLDLKTYGTGELNLNTNNTKTMSLASNGDVSFYEDTGSVPKMVWDASAEKLRLSGADNHSAVLAENSLNFDRGAANYIMASNASGWLEFYAGNSRAMVVKADGKVGIGESNPDTSLDVVGGSADSVVDTLTLKNDSTGASAGVGINFVVDGVNDVTTSAIYGQRTGASYHQGSLQFLTKDSAGGGLLERMRIDSSGNLLVGTTNDNSRLTLNQSGDETISIVDSRSATSGVFRSGITWRDYLNNAAGGIYYEHNEYFGTAFRALVFKPAGTAEKMRLSAAGQLRLGTSTENANILIRSEANTPWLNCTNNSEDAFGFHLYNDGTNEGTNVPFARMGINYSGTRNSSINFYRGTSSTGGFMAFTTNNDTERMRIDPSGYVTMPYQPAFWAWNSSIQSSEGPVVFVSTDLNNGGHYNTSTGRFTAPVSGIYEFQAMALFRKEGTSGSGEITLYINGSNVSGRGLVYGGAGNADTAHHPLSFTYRRYLNANDYAQLYIHDLSDAGSDMYLSSRLSWFSGRLIG